MTSVIIISFQRFIFFAISEVSKNACGFFIFYVLLRDQKSSCELKKKFSNAKKVENQMRMTGSIHSVFFCSLMGAEKTPFL